jgi:hypothetical protein
LREEVSCELGEIDVRENRTRDGAITGHRWSFPLVGAILRK